MIAWLRKRFGKTTPVVAAPTPEPPTFDALAWLDAHKAEVSIGVSPGGAHTRIYDHVTKLPHYGHTLLQAAAAAQRSRDHHT